jgi:hypothetical protein
VLAIFQTALFVSNAKDYFDLSLIYINLKIVCIFNFNIAFYWNYIVRIFLIIALVIDGGRLH